MKKVSYAQNLEDVILDRVFKLIEKGTYVDVGAGHPNEDSVTKHFYERGWTGINLEPNPIYAKALKEYRKNDVNLEFVVGSDDETKSFYLVSEKGNCTGLSTLNKDIAKLHQASGMEITEIIVGVKNLSAVFKEFIKTGEIHFLKIDVEGAEHEVLLTNNFTEYRPWVVLIESTKPNTDIQNFEDSETYLMSKNYTFVYTDQLNRFYLANERMELFSSFLYPPNIFDGFDFSLGKFMKSYEELQSHNVELANEIDKLKNSLSWFITKPFRIAKTYLQLFKTTIFP